MPVTVGMSGFSYRRFLEDYRSAPKGRYVAGLLPSLPFESARFDLTLVSYLLLVYEDHFSYEFHRLAILDMLRVAGEVRVFPLVTLMLKPSPYVEPLLQELQSLGYTAQIHTVQYELQRGGNQLLCIKRHPKL